MAMHLVAIVTILSLALYLYMLIRVGNARTQFGVAAPATTGHPEFERTLRVQLNTLESLPLYLPALWLFASYVSAWIAVVLGIVWIAGRYLYMEGYIMAAEQRSMGFGIQAIATILLLAGAFLGAVWDLFF